IEPADAREGNRRRAHHAGFERDVEIAIGKPLGVQFLRRLAQRQNLRMRRRIALAQRPVVGARDDFAAPYDKRTHRNLARAHRRGGDLQRLVHVVRLAHSLPVTFVLRRLASHGHRMDRKPDNDKERIAKVMARAGLCSRREAETWILAGRVAVNGETLTSPAFTVSPRDEIAVDGKPLPGRERTRLFLYHKPKGLVTTNRDERDR